MAARLSPPDSTITTSRPGNCLSRSRDGGEVDAGVLADGRVRAAAGLDADDALQRQHLAAGQELGVLAGVDVVGDDGQVDLGPERPAEPLDQRRLARADRPADAEGEDAAASARRRPAAACVVVAVASRCVQWRGGAGRGSASGPEQSCV